MAGMVTHPASLSKPGHRPGVVFLIRHQPQKYAHITFETSSDTTELGSDGERDGEGTVARAGGVFHHCLGHSPPVLLRDSGPNKSGGIILAMPCSIQLTQVRDGHHDDGGGDDSDDNDVVMMMKMMMMMVVVAMMTKMIMMIV